MVTHNGKLLDYRKGSMQDNTTVTTVDYLTNFILGDLSITNKVSNIEEHSGTHQNTGFKMIDHNIFLFPDEISIPLISENIEHIITLWNASQETQVLIDIIIDGQQGITLEGIDPPYEIYPENILLFTLTVLSDGQPTQNTTITFTFQEHPPITLTIEGTRILGFPYITNSGDFTIDYNFETVIFNSDRFKEQRRGLLDKYKRTLSGGFIYQDIEQKQLLRFLVDNYNKVLGVPIYSEPLFFGIDIQGLSVVPLINTTTNYDNLEIADYAIILDNNTHIAEIKEILYFTTNSIVFSNNVTKYFNYETSLIFPVFTGFLHEKNVDELLSSLSQVSLTFKEVFI